MSVSWGATGTNSAGASTTATPAYPTSLSAGMLIVAVAATCSSTDPVPTISGSGWSSPVSVSGGPGSFGVDDGPRRVTVWWKEATGSETGTETVTISGTTPTCSAQMARFSKTLSDWRVEAAGGSDTTDGTGYATSASGISVLNGGQILAASAWHPDTATPSSSAVAWTGTGTSTLSGRSAFANANGNDVRLTIQTRDVTGDSSGNPAYSCTLSAAGGGSTIIVAISDEDSGVTGSGAVTAPAATADGAGSLSLTGSGAGTAPAATVDGAGDLSLSGAGAVTAPAATATGAGDVEEPAEPATGSGAVTGPAPTATGSGSLSLTGAAAVEAAGARIDASGEVTEIIVATGTAAVTGPSASVEAAGTVPALIFQPPTYEVGMHTQVRPLNYYRQTYGISVVRINGVLTAVRVPSSAQLRAAGDEGTDYFIGGHVYTVTKTTADELELAGFPVTES